MKNLSGKVIKLKDFFMKAKISFFLVSLFLISCAHNTHKKEHTQKEDIYWSELVNEAEISKTPILSLLMNKNAGLYKQIEKDSKDSNLLAFWGQSLNFDSGARQKIVADKILNDLHSQFGQKTDNMIVNAGITHTYGYLFSVLDTPYGYKRKRWTEPTLNYAFGFSGNSLSPETIEGGLLSNLTYFAGTLAFKNANDRNALKKLTNVSKEVLNFDYTKLPVVHLDEEFSHYALRTTLVHFPFKSATEENDYLLIYSIVNKELKKEVLITAFPIKKDAYNKITAHEFIGSNQPISVRYNAYLEGFMNQKISGVRKIMPERESH